MGVASDLIGVEMSEPVKDGVLELFAKHGHPDEIKYMAQELLSMSNKLIGCVQHDCADCKRREQEMDDLRTKLAAAEAEIAAIRKDASASLQSVSTKLAEAEKDAARYRWLRIHQVSRQNYLCFTDKNLDAAIDAAMKEQA